MKTLKTTLMLALFLLSVASTIHAQKYFSKTGSISFYSHTSIEDIEAVSNTATTVYDHETGKIQWAVLIKSFEFEKALMQEHFNENYMESSKYPKATFKGSLTDDGQINLDEDGTYTVDIQGKLTIHGMTNEITTKAKFIIESGSIQANSTLKVLVADYGIEIPSVVKENIAKEIEIDINANYELLDKS